MSPHSQTRSVDLRGVSPKNRFANLADYGIGVMIAMSPSVILKGAVKFSMKKLIAGGEIATSTFTGPGELLLAPPFIGDMSTIRLTGQETWNVGKDSFIACTQGVVKDYKNQGFSKAMFSGEGLFVMKVTGTGIMWLASFGAIVRKDVSHTGMHIVKLQN